MTKAKEPSEKARNLYHTCGAETHLKGVCQHIGTRPDGRCWYHSVHSKPRSLERQAKAAEVRQRMLAALDKASHYHIGGDDFNHYAKIAVLEFVDLRQLSYKPLRKRQRRDGMQGTTTRSAMAAFLFNSKGA